MKKIIELHDYGQHSLITNAPTEKVATCSEALYMFLKDKWPQIEGLNETKKGLITL